MPSWDAPGGAGLEARCSDWVVGVPPAAAVPLGSTMCAEVSL